MSLAAASAQEPAARFVGAVRPFVPAVAGMKQDNTRMIVLFPAPLRPMIPNASPFCTENETSLTAATLFAAS